MCANLQLRVARRGKLRTSPADHRLSRCTLQAVLCVVVFVCVCSCVRVSMLCVVVVCVYVVHYVCKHYCSRKLGWDNIEHNQKCTHNHHRVYEVCTTLADSNLDHVRVYVIKWLYVERCPKFPGD